MFSHCPQITVKYNTHDNPKKTLGGKLVMSFACHKFPRVRFWESSIWNGKSKRERERARASEREKERQRIQLRRKRTLEVVFYS